MNIIDEIRQDVTGAQILKDWLGEGMQPVSPELAAHRSLSCITGYEGKPCPHNREAKWWESAKGAVAGYILEQLAIKNRAKVSVPLEESLKMCAACGCALPLKVHVPIKYIQAHTVHGNQEKLPAWCWMRQELENS